MTHEMDVILIKVSSKAELSLETFLAPDDPRTVAEGTPSIKCEMKSTTDQELVI